MSQVWLDRHLPDANLQYNPDLVCSEENVKAEARGVFRFGAKILEQWPQFFEHYARTKLLSCVFPILPAWSFSVLGLRPT